MKNVIKMFVAVAMLGVMSVSAFAQGAGPGGAKGAPGQKGPGGPGGGMRRGDDTILATLNLTDKQKTAIKSLKDATKVKSDELRKSLGLGGGGGKPGAGAGAGKPGAGAPGGGRPHFTPEMRQKFKAIQDFYHSGLAKILTPTQMTAYDKARKDAMAKRQAEGGGPGGPGATKGKGKGTPPPTA